MPDPCRVPGPFGWHTLGRAAVRILGPVRWVTVAASAGLLALVGACTPGSAEPDVIDASPTIRPQLRGDDDDVLVLGDSLVNGARLFGDLGDRLDAAGFDTLEIVAEDGRDTAWGLEQVEGRPRVPELVVVELGTNPDADPSGFADTAAALVEALRARGAERIAWLTPVHGRDDRYEAKVQVLATTPGIDSVADWASVVRADPRRLAADGLHPTRDGYVELAGFLVDTAAELAGD